LLFRQFIRKFALLHKIFSNIVLLPTLVSFLIIFLFGDMASALTLPSFDFKQTNVVREWQPTNDISHIKTTSEGMLIEISGKDPYTIGPAQTYPHDLTLRLRIRLKSEQAGMGKIFFFKATKGANEEDSVSFSIPKPGVWVEALVPIPTLGPNTLLRIDPPGVGTGKCVIQSLTFEPRVRLKEPQWPMPTAPQLGSSAFSVRSGNLFLIHDKHKLDNFRIHVAGKDMATGFNRPLIGYVRAGQQQWLNLSEKAQITTSLQEGTLAVKAVATDSGGARWKIEQRFTKAKLPGAIDVATTVTVNQDRIASFLPMLAILPGVRSFGTVRNHGLFAGLEYLDKPDVSSSEADIVGPGSKRQIPDTEKITFPLMAMQANDRYIGLIWDKTSKFSAVFDSPDRLFKSGGHVMGVMFPGPSGMRLVKGSLRPDGGETLKKGKPLVLRATIIGGTGKSVVPAVQQYVALRGLPHVPAWGMDKQGYVSLTAGGWLDSQIRVGNEFRHAYWPGAIDAKSRTADAPVFMEWLAHETEDVALRKRLLIQAKATIAEVSPVDYNTAGVSHVKYHVPALIYGNVAENAERAEKSARSKLDRFEPDGTLLYKPSPGGQDFGNTHFAPDASGMTAGLVASLLQDTMFSGDSKLISEGLRVLRALDKFHDSAPRGAQTWEVPLHTPDILASAHMVRAYTLGYELTGDQRYLKEAIYWAWTGVPFIYLVKSTSQPGALYSTIAVLGASGWKAPNWIGLPVQWCGLVYSDALYRLLRHDPTGPWKQIADGVTTSGIQQIWPRSNNDFQGLLPDSYDIRSQTRNFPAINPGTLQANATHFLGGPEIYDFRVFRKNSLIAHAPGTISDVKEQLGRISFTVKGNWLEHPYNILLVGLQSAPLVRARGQEVQSQYIREKGRLIVRVRGDARVDMRMK
jgi:hypothetical protein